jgi:hypothetical protein
VSARTVKLAEFSRSGRSSEGTCSWLWLQTPEATVRVDLRPPGGQSCPCPKNAPRPAPESASPLSVLAFAGLFAAKYVADAGHPHRVKSRTSLVERCGPLLQRLSSSPVCLACVPGVRALSSRVVSTLQRQVAAHHFRHAGWPSVSPARLLRLEVTNQPTTQPPSHTHLSVSNPERT